MVILIDGVMKYNVDDMLTKKTWEIDKRKGKRICRSKDGKSIGTVPNNVLIGWVVCDTDHGRCEHNEDILSDGVWSAMPPLNH